MAAIEVARNRSDHNYDAPPDGIAGGHHVICGFGNGFVQAVIGPFVLLRNSPERGFDL